MPEPVNVNPDPPWPYPTISHADAARLLRALHDPTRRKGHVEELFGCVVFRCGPDHWLVDGRGPLTLEAAIDRLLRHWRPVEGL